MDMALRAWMPGSGILVTKALMQVLCAQVLGKVVEISTCFPVSTV